MTKHGLAAALRSDEAGEIRADVDAYQLMHGVGNLFTEADTDARYDPRPLVGPLLAGLRRPQ